MTQIIATSGKGGVGKTTITALIIKYLSKNFSDRDILIIDGDPSSNIPEVIGLTKKTEIDKTISTITTKLKRKIEKGQIPPGFDKSLALESDIQSIIYEEDEFDLLVLGRGEGKGCYCFINNLLKNIVDPLEEQYDLIVMDMPAGLEHLSRRTDKNVDDLLVVTDMSKMGFNAMERIVEISQEVHLEFDKFWIIGNRFDEDAKHYLTEKVEELGNKFKINIELIGFVPTDKAITKANLESIPLTSIEDDNPAYIEVKKISERIFKH
ncbi:MAG: AAA family ATPase [archaeon]|nr:AAA family ATPase [archaeon]